VLYGKKKFYTNAALGLVSSSILKANTILCLFFFSDVEKGVLNLTFPVMFNPVTWDVHLFPVYFGGSVLNENLTIESVPSLQLGYFITVDDERQDAM
jgi:hypothetical protein